MCNRAIPENGRTLEFIPHRYKTQEICNEAVDSYALLLLALLHLILFPITMTLKKCVSKLLIVTLLQ